MGYATKVQLIQRRNGVDQWYVTVPTAVAAALDFLKAEEVHWHIEDKANLVLHRVNVPASPVSVKKNLRRRW
jgi:hypothetical protein